MLDPQTYYLLLAGFFLWFFVLNIFWVNIVVIYNCVFVSKSLKKIHSIKFIFIHTFILSQSELLNVFMSSIMFSCLLTIRVCSI